MILVANGMPKSASSFSYLLAYAVLLTRPERVVPRENLPGWLRRSFFQSVDELLPVLVERVPVNQVYIIKTHAPFSPEIKRHIERGEVKVSYTWRDPYDNAVSLLDAGVRERRKLEPGERREVFATIRDPEDALERVVENAGIAREWLQAAASLPGIIPVSYECIRQQPVALALRYARELDIPLPPERAEKLVNDLLEDRSRIWEYNRGVSGRGKQINVPADHPLRAVLDQFSHDFPQTLPSS